ncbi:MAG: flagellar motor switch protein FliN [Hyphomicrobiaceae bacterium]
MAPDDDAWRQRGQDALMRIPVAVRIVLGGTRMPFAKLMALTRGSVIPLDRKVGDLVDIVVNDRLVARGEVVVLNDDAQRFAIAVRDVVRSSDS